MRKEFLLLVMLAAFLGFGGEILAAGFAVVGARALGMGGAQVAAVDDITAIYWNPAAMAGYKEGKFSFPLGIRVVEHNDITDTLTDIDDVLGDYSLDDPEIYLNETKRNQLLELFTKLDESGTGLVATGNTGLIVSRGNSAFGILELAYLGGWVTMDLDRIEIVPPAVPNSISNNQSSVTALGLESRELTLSDATQVGPIFIGANVKYIFGRTYYKSVSVADESNDLEEDLAKMSDSDFGCDVGFLYPLPERKLKTGLVVKNLNTPSFSYEDGEVELKPQARAGIAWEVGENLLIACDLDLTENETMTPGYDNRTLAVGIEKKTRGGKLALRGGLYKNIAESNADPVITGGLGVGSERTKFDIGVGIGLDMDELTLCLAFSTIF